MRSEIITEAPVEQAILVGVQIGPARQQAMTLEASLEELELLAGTAGISVLANISQNLDSPNASTLIGKGKLEELKILLDETGATTVIFDEELEPRHQRELEAELGSKIKVLDRTALILDIFAQHARSAEGKLQVELAQLEYSYARQEGLWQHLERLGGGIGTRGPGESQLESDRRMVRNRIATLRRRLADVARTRDTQRRRRTGTELTRVALAGYTNAGKSSLMNALAGAEVTVNDALFETLDATTRRVVADGHELLLSDTVGFIRHLPHQLVNAFSSTLEEVRDTDLILHVADASEDESRREAQAAAVVSVLEEIGAGDVPRLLVLNKIDRLDADERHALAHRHPDALRVSALTGEGLDDLRAALADAARDRLVAVDVTIPFRLSALVSDVYAAGREVEREDTAEGTRMRALMPPAAAGRLRAAIATG